MTTAAKEEIRDLLPDTTMKTSNTTPTPTSDEAQTKVDGISAPAGPANSTDKLDKQQLKVMGGFLRYRLEQDPFYVAKLFIRLLSKNFYKIATRIILIISLGYGIRWFLLTYTTIPKVYSSLILIAILILYYTRKQRNYATTFLIRFMLFVGSDRLLTYHFNKPPGTLLVLVIIIGLLYYTWSGIFKHVRTEAHERNNMEVRQ